MDLHAVTVLVVFGLVTASVTRLLVTDGFPFGRARRVLRAQWPAWGDQFDAADAEATLEWVPPQPGMSRPWEDGPPDKKRLQVPATALPVNGYRLVQVVHADTGVELVPEVHRNGEPTGLFIPLEGTWLGELTDCPYCAGMWVGLATAAWAVYLAGLPAWWWLPLALAYRQVAGRYS